MTELYYTYCGNCLFNNNGTCIFTNTEVEDGDFCKDWEAIENENA